MYEFGNTWLQIMHQSFVTTAPLTTGKGQVGDSWAKVHACMAITFRVFPQCRGNDGVLA